MKNIKIKNINIENFKGIKAKGYSFGNKTLIKGMNATGKTSVVDAFTWLLFGTDSQGNTKFQVRPVDDDGNPIHFVEINVEATVEVDGQEFTLLKRQKEKWVKKRGSEEQEFQGNVNEFEINGYPKTEKDYKEFIADMVDEKIFKLITNPMAFTGMAWKDQRKILFQLVSDITDIDIATRNTEFGPLVQELNVASIDDIKAKYVKAKNDLNKQLTELPARIDEVSKQIVYVDVSDLELQRNILKENITGLEAKLDNVSLIANERKKASENILNMKFELSDMERKANSDLDKKRSELNRSLSNRKYDLSTLVMNIQSSERTIANMEKSIKDYEARKLRLKNEYKSATERVFDENSLVCPYCGQEYQQEKKGALLAEFESHKQEEISKIVADGRTVANDISAMQESMKKEQEKLNASYELKKVAEDDISRISLEIEAIPSNVDMSSDAEYQKLLKAYEEAEKSMNEEFSLDNELTTIKQELDHERKLLLECELDIAKADCSLAEERKAELEEEQRTVGQKVADVEKILYIVEQFTKAKLDIISDMVNSKFQMVNFKLFSHQINGGISECCECTYNGVPFSVLNTGHRIAAGIDIVRTLSEIYGISAPLFVDNAEAINEVNIPKTETQLVLLSVTEDKEISVEVCD